MHRTQHENDVNIKYITYIIIHFCMQNYLYIVVVEEVTLVAIVYFECIQEKQRVVMASKTKKVKQNERKKEKNMKSHPNAKIIAKMNGMRENDSKTKWQGV